MIPKIFHLCWLSGDPYPKKIKYCIRSWKRHNPDYEVMLWDTKRFDVNSTSWTKQAFEAKKYAFAADYIRLYAVYNYGGIYLDSDVEVIESFDDVLDLPYFVGNETDDTSIELAAFGAEKGSPWVKAALDWYDGRDFIKEDGSMELEVQPLIMNRVLGSKYALTPIKGKEEVTQEEDKLFIFPNEWFNAHPFDGNGGCVYKVTNLTHCIHHYAGQWRPMDYGGGPLHKLYYKIFFTNWRLSDRYVKLYRK